MEPNISDDLTHEVTPPQDLTFSQLRDIGWVPSAIPTGISKTGGDNQNAALNAIILDAASGDREPRHRRHHRDVDGQQRRRRRGRDLPEHERPRGRLGHERVGRRHGADAHGQRFVRSLLPERDRAGRGHDDLHAAG